MARPVEFDRDIALRDAMLQFWRQGYHKTSVRDLTEATQLKPGSLYGAFENKRALFLHSLDYYANQLKKSVDSLLHSEEPPLVRIHLFFQYLLDEMAGDPEGKGCLLVNTLLETPVEDEAIKQQVSSALAYVEQTFQEVIEEAVRRGDLLPDKDPAALARLLMAGIFGLRVYTKMRPQQGVLDGIVKSLLAALVR